MVTTTVRLPDDLAKRYQQLADETGRTKTYYLTQALSESIGRLEYEYGLLKQVEDYRAGRLQTHSLDEVRKNLGLED